MTTTRETHLVELVDADGQAIGSATVGDAHRAPGRLHRAFSVFLRDPAGLVLVQQRAAEKTRFPLRWANTCCGHPEPGADLAESAARRVVEEIGIGGVALSEVGVYSYYAEDPATGRVEYEYDHVLLGEVPASRPVLTDADEVAGVRWVPVEELRADLTADPRAYAPWLAGVLERLEEHLGLALNEPGDRLRDDGPVPPPATESPDGRPGDRVRDEGEPGDRLQNDGGPGNRLRNDGRPGDRLRDEGEPGGRVRNEGEPGGR
jgi:isopentenyl-diphosphate delta-isomerase